MAVKEGGRWRGERQAKQQSKVRERGQKYKGSSDNNRRGRGDANGQQRSAGRTVDQQKRQRSRQKDEPDWTTARDRCWWADGFFFFVIVVFCSMRSLAPTGVFAGCGLLSSVVSPTLDHLSSLTIQPFFRTTSHYFSPPLLLLKPSLFENTNAAKRHWITMSMHDSLAELSFFQRLDRAVAVVVPNNLEKRAIYAQSQGPGRVTI